MIYKIDIKDISHDGEEVSHRALLFYSPVYDAVCIMKLEGENSEQYLLDVKACEALKEVIEDKIKFSIRVVDKHLICRRTSFPGVIFNTIFIPEDKCAIALQVLEKYLTKSSVAA